MALPTERFPLFPLGLVLLPGELVPLHIFEERYKQMIGECLDEQREFGILWLADDALKDVGCTARITRVLERFDDGRMNIVVEGATPFRLERRIGELAYPAGDIELLDDDPGTDEDALERARKSYADLVEQVTETRPEPEALAELGAYGMAATLDIAAWLKSFDAAFVAKDLDKLAGFYHPDVTIYEGTGVNNGWPNYRDTHLGPELKSFSGLEFGHTNASVRMLGDHFAYATSEFFLKTQMNGKPLDLVGRETLILEHADGAWKIRHAHLATRSRVK